jgi:CelD/BcsL family acetyltransferase involved in cellulose biosynthesis
MLTAQIVRTDDLGPAEVALWSELLRQTPPGQSAFLSFAYAKAADRVYPGVRVAKLSLNERTVGFFAFQYRSSVHRALGWGERVSGELADYFGVVADHRVRLSGTELMRLCGLSALYFTHLEESQTLHGLHGEKPETGLRIELPEGGGAFWEARKRTDRKFTADTERRERKLVESFGPLAFVFRHPDTARELRSLIAAKRAQYERTEAGDSLALASSREFLFDLAGSADPDCRPTLSTLHAGSTWVGSHFGLMCGSTLHYWFPVYNPNLRSFAPGRLLLKAIIDSSSQTDVRAIDRGAGDSPSKRDFATSEHQFMRGVWSRPGPSSFAYRAGLSLGWRLGRRRTKNNQADKRHVALMP